MYLSKKGLGQKEMAPKYPVLKIDAHMCRGLEKVWGTKEPADKKVMSLDS